PRYPAPGKPNLSGDPHSARRAPRVQRSQQASSPGGCDEIRTISYTYSAPGDCPMEEKTRRGAVLTIFAALFVLLALSDISKPLSGGRAGLVFFGTKTKGLANAILAPAFGIFLL